MSFSKDSQVGARVSPWVKETIKRNGYSISDAVTYFAECLRKDNPRLAGEIRLNVLEKELRKTQKKIQELYFEEEEIKEEMSQLKLQLESLPNTNEFKSDKDLEWETAVNIVQNAMDNLGGNLSKQEKFDKLIVEKGDMFMHLHKNFCRGKSWIVFKEELFESVV